MASPPNHATGFVFNATPPPPKPPDRGEQIGITNKKMSFRDILTEGQQMHQAKERVDLIAKGLMKVTLEEGNRLLPVVTMDEKLFQDLCNPWKEALVVKLLGKKVGYNMMKDRLKTLWKLSGGFEIMDVDNGFYMVKCGLLADREKIMSEGPWMLFDHYLAVARWTPDFASPHAKVEKTLVWIRFPGLNLLYYDESVLLGLASVVGTPIKVDTNTLKVERGRFARICVEIDLTLPVVGKVNVNGHWYKVQYEGLHIICGACGCYGHHTRDCKITPVQQPPMGQTQEHHGGQKAGNHERKATVVEQNENRNPASLAAESAKVNETHGEWLVVQRKKKNNKGKTGQTSSLATNLPKHVGNKKGKEQTSSLKGASDNKSQGVGPSHTNTNPKKRRIDKSGNLENHLSITRGPQAKEKSSNHVIQHVTNDMKNKEMTGINHDHGTTSPMNITVTPKHQATNILHKETNNNHEVEATLHHEPQGYERPQVMEESKTQEEERVPDSPIDWEQT
ncbi:hypothetical protein L195_g015996 [Trifolium pratense]|uniref:DUF4283 domain-containing protein n=1 Tax=Trifolium pratense TaxID=57577 RepID=A0A2K3MPW4_TRIPR|nr:hypothetical protein L195_g015996 [Trifolium pratense]